MTRDDADDHVEPAHLRHRAVDRGRDLGRVGGVGGEGEGPAAEAPDGLGHRVDLLGGPGEQDDVGAGVGEGQRGRGADAAAGAGHQGHAAVEAEEGEGGHGPRSTANRRDRACLAPRRGGDRGPDPYE